MLTYISESEFDALDPSFRIIAHDHARRFGSLRLPAASHPLGLSWRSDTIDPVIVTDPHSSAVWIGVDQRVACLSPEGTVLLSLGLGGSLLQIKEFEAFTLVLSDMEVIAINRNYSLRATTHLKDIPDSVAMENGVLTVTFIDGEKQVLTI